MKTHIREQCALRHISNMNFQSWAVLGSWGSREKKIQTAISICATFEASFFMFSLAKNIYFLENTLMSSLKSYMIQGLS
jgi:hypothetical protein